MKVCDLYTDNTPVVSQFVVAIEMLICRHFDLEEDDTLSTWDLQKCYLSYGLQETAD